MLRIILCGFGIVGQSFAKLLLSRSEDLYAKHGLKPRIVGVFDSKGSAVSSAGLDLNRLLEVKKKFGNIRKYHNKEKDANGLEMIKGMDAEVLIETTPSNYKNAEPGMSHIVNAMKKGIHVITVNKGPLALAFPSLIELTTSDIKKASAHKSAVKLIASCDRVLEVAPKEIPLDDPLCVNGTLNAITFNSEHSGQQTIIGRGAGGMETASSILRDLLDIKQEMSRV